MNVLVTHLAPREVKYLNDEFEKLDVQQNGYLQYDDLRDAVKNSGFDISNKEMDQILKEIDFERNKKIKYSEFLAASIDTSKFLTDSRL